jgi:sec-independent protein translocase protein TatB
MDSFFGIGLFELMLIAVIALVVMGPERLPGAMRELAKYMRQLRQISGEFQSQFSEELQMLDELNPKRIINDAIMPAPPAKPAPQQPLKPPAQTAKQTAKPAARPAPAQPLAANGEAENSMLPPDPTPGAPAGVAQNGASLHTPAPNTAPADAPSPRDIPVGATPSVPPEDAPAAEAAQ